MATVVGWIVATVAELAAPLELAAAVAASTSWRCRRMRAAMLEASELIVETGIV
jgi:hypothetical protein